jgi:hypothetical protein
MTNIEYIQKQIDKQNRYLKHIDRNHSESVKKHYDDILEEIRILEEIKNDLTAYYRPLSELGELHVFNIEP